MFLTDAELHKLTGYVAPAAQARWLEERGWRFERNRAGRVIVSRAHAESMMGGAAPRVAGPKFEAIFDDTLRGPYGPGQSELRDAV